MKMRAFDPEDYTYCARLLAPRPYSLFPSRFVVVCLEGNVRSMAFCPCVVRFSSLFIAVL